MSSSRTPASATTSTTSGAHRSLLGLLETVPDPRDPRGRRHDLAVVLAVGLAAVIAGARSFVAIGEWVAHQPAAVLAELGVTGGAGPEAVSYTHLRAHETVLDLVCRLLLEKKKKK